MRFLLAGSGGWLVSLGKQEADPDVLSLHLHLIFCPFCLLLPSLEGRRCRCIGKENGVSCVTLPIPGYHYILQYLLCSGASFFNLTLSSPGGGFRGYFGAGRASKPEPEPARRVGLRRASAELAEEELARCVGCSRVGALGKPRKRKLCKPKLKGVNVEGLVNVVYPQKKEIVEQ